MHSLAYCMLFELKYLSSKTKFQKLDKNIKYWPETNLSNALIIFFLASKIGVEKAQFNSSAPWLKFKNMGHRILGKEFLYWMNQFFSF